MKKPRAREVNSVSIPKPHIRFSYEDYRSLVATSDKRYELFDGEAIEVHALGSHGYEMKGRYRKGDRFASPLFPGLTLPLGDAFEAE